MTTAYITDTRFAAHNLEGHSEHAGRLTTTQELFKKHDIPRRTLQITPNEVNFEQIHAVHTEDYMTLLSWTERQRGMQLTSDTYVLPISYGVARLAAGAAVAGVDAVLSGQARNAIVMARPPGHHATRQMGMGFCLLANVSIAARHAQQAYGLKKVMIVDYDVHHGNGTQDVFYDDPSVMFLSTHQSPWYPGTGAISETGVGAGVGTTVNLPLPAGTGDEGYGQIFERVVWPVARRFEPELIIVSAGFDAHWDDPLGEMKLSLKGYDHLSRQLITMADSICQGRIVFVMEGGYNVTTLSNGLLNVAFALLGDSQLADPRGPAKGPETDIRPIIERVIQTHKLA